MFCTEGVVFAVDLLNFDDAATAWTDTSLHWLVQFEDFHMLTWICKGFRRDWFNAARLCATVDDIFLRSIGFPGTFAIGQTHCFLFARFPHGDSTGPGFRIAKKAVCTAIILLQIWYGVGATAPLSIRIVAILRKLRGILLTLPIPAQMWARSKCMGDLQAEHNCLEEQNGAASQQGWSHRGLLKQTTLYTTTPAQSLIIDHSNSPMQTAHESSWNEAPSWVPVRLKLSRKESK